MSLKASVATVAAIFALVAGADIAQAGLLPVNTDESAAVSGALGDDGLVGDLPGDGEGDEGLLNGLVGDGTGDGGVGDVLDDATDAVDDTLDGAGNVVDDAKSDVDATLSGVGDTVDKTVSGAVGAVDEIVEDSPAGGVVDDVKRSIDPVVDVVGQASGLAASAPPAASGSASEVGVESRLGNSAPAAGQMMRPGTASVPTNAAQKSVPSPVSSALQQQAAPPVQPTGRASARFDGDTAATQHDRLRATSWGQLSAAPKDANGTEASSSAKAPALPFGPLFPVDLLATAAAAAGAAGSALTVALLCALVLLAPRAGRLARPGPILVGPEPFLSLSERPG